MNKGSNPLVIVPVDALLSPAHLPVGNNIRLAAYGWRDARQVREEDDIRAGRVYLSDFSLPLIQRYIEVMILRGTKKKGNRRLPVYVNLLCYGRLCRCP